MPNTEFGHLEIRGKDAEERASERAKTAHDMNWKQWAKNVSEYLEHIEALVYHELFIVGGGISRQSGKFLPLLTGLHVRAVPAAMFDDAGITGAAMAAHPARPPRSRPGAGATANPSLGGAIGVTISTTGDRGPARVPQPGTARVTSNQ